MRATTRHPRTRLVVTVLAAIAVAATVFGGGVAVGATTCTPAPVTPAQNILTELGNSPNRIADVVGDAYR